MENQVFVFGSFSEDEASLFQFSSSESVSTQKQTASPILSSEENGFHSLASPSLTDKTISRSIEVESTDSSTSSVQWTASQASGLPLLVDPGDKTSRMDIRHGKMNGSSVLANADGAVHKNEGDDVRPEEGAEFCNADRSIVDLAIEHSGIQSRDSALDAGEVISFLHLGLPRENQALHQAKKEGNLDDLALHVGGGDFVRETIPELTARPAVEFPTTSSDTDTTCRNPVESLGDDSSAPVLLAENIPKTWAARLGMQSKLFQATGQPKAGTLVSSRATVVKGDPENSSNTVKATGLAGELWLRSLKEAEVSGKRLQPRGLINTGNSCFLNATLQALLSCAPFVHLLRTLEIRGIPQVGYQTLRTWLTFFKEFEFQHEDGRTTRSVDVGKPFVPAMFDNVLQSFSPQQSLSDAGRNRQEDCQEFLSFTMNQMHEELLQLEGRGQNSAEKGNLIVAVANEEDDWETVGRKNRTAVIRTHTFMSSALSDIFGGQLCSVIKTKGIKASATVQPFFLLHLDIILEAVQTVEDALKLFSAPESLEGYKATSGKAAVVSASKSIKLQSLPRVLIIHLKRFSYGAQGSSKLHKAVRFPAELILGRDLLANTINAGSEVRHYELVATVTHHGKEPSHGHYTADSKQSNGQWLRYDDNMVSSIGLTRVLQDQAYLLFYKRLVNSR